MRHTSEPEVTPAGSARLTRVEQVMGMPIVIEVCDAAVTPAALDRAYRWLTAVDATFSTYRPDSEISGIRSGAITVDRASLAVRTVLERCDDLKWETDGYFDAYAGGRLDPSGLVKGWAVAGGARVLEQAGAVNYCINAGGDILVRGNAPQGGLWRIGIQHPREPHAIAAVVALDRGAVATSGTYARGHHIADPHTGLPAAELEAATVIGPDLPTADAYATAAVAMGERARRWCLERAPYEFMLITADAEVLTTPGFGRFRMHDQDGVRATRTVSTRAIAAAMNVRPRQGARSTVVE